HRQVPRENFMADVTYKIVTVYETQGLGQIHPDAARAAEALDKLGGAAMRAEGILERLNSYLMGYLGFSLIKGQIEALGHEFVTLNAQAESLQIQLAGMFQAGAAPGLTGPDKFRDAMQASSELIVKMRKDARELPGTFQDLMNLFQPVLATGLG